MSTTTAILKDVVAACREAGGITDEMVKLGYFTAKDAHKGTRIYVAPGEEDGEDIDSEETRRTLQVNVAAILKIDRGSDVDEVEQMLTEYDAIHLVLEDLKLTNVNGKACSMTGGTKLFGSYDDGDSFVWAGSSWEIEFERALGTA